MYLYGCETLCLTFREEYRLRVFLNRVLRRIFGPKEHEDGKKSHSEDHDLQSLPYFIQVSNE
jgi:hypothetical protein